ncbi:MAG: CbtA family protein [Pseudonocardia sp.]|nr:CbtA family protein [Pseudonocardia sp.]
MVRSLLVRGMIAGLIAGLLYFLFAYLFGEASVDAAIAYEEQAAAAAREASNEAPLVSRGIQATIGLAAAALIYGAALGGVFALVYSAVYGRIGRLTPRETAAVLALVGFVAVIVVPFLKYPASPPASSIDGTIGSRTGLYLAMIIFSVVLAAGAILLGRRLLARFGTRNATLLAAGAYVAAAGIVGYLMPVVAETPADFPATVLYQFRLASFGGQLVLWTALGLVFGALIDGSSRRSGSRPSIDPASL